MGTGFVLEAAGGIRYEVTECITPQPFSPHMSTPDADRDDDRPRRPDRDGDDRPRRRRREYDPDPTGGLIPLKNGMSLAAYYCGVFSFIPCFGLVLGPLAIVFGFLGLSHARKYPDAKGKGHSIAGVICGALSTLGHIAAAIFIVIASRP